MRATKKNVWNKKFQIYFMVIYYAANLVILTVNYEFVTKEDFKGKTVKGTEIAVLVLGIIIFTIDVIMIFQFIKAI